MIVWGRYARWQEMISAETLQRWPDDVVIVSREREQEVPHSRRIVVSEQLWGADLLEIARKVSPFRHVIQMDQPDFERAVNMAAMLIVRPQEFMDNPCEHLMQITKAEVAERFPFRRATSKYELLDRIESHVRSITSSESVLDSARAICDELFTNVVMDATKKGVPSLGELKLKGEFFLVHDEGYLIIGCEDNRGNLSPEKLLERIHECYRRGPGNAINLGSGGAGIGCFLVVEHSTSFFMSVKPGQKTIVLARLPLKGHLKRVQSTPKNLHVMALEN